MCIYTYIHHVVLVVNVNLHPFDFFYLSIRFQAIVRLNTLVTILIFSGSAPTKFVFKNKGAVKKLP